MKKRLLTILFALVSLMGWAQSVDAPEFTFEGDNLVMTTNTPNASIFYGIADLPDLLDETITAVQNSLIDLPEYYQNPIELKKNVVIKAITLAEEGGSTVQSDTTIYVYGYSVWQMLVTAMTRGNSVYDVANGNPNVDESLLQDLHWALEEGEMFYGMRGSAPHFEAEHFANMINNYCDEIEAIIGPVTTVEPYAALSENNTVLTFYYDDQKDARNGMSVGPFGSKDDRGWNEYASNITSVVFDDSFADCTTLTSTAEWYNGFSNLITITGISNLKTDNVKSMYRMFANCSNLTSLDLSNFNTENVETMFAMFANCSNLTSLDVSGFKTNNVTIMSNMFNGCSSLTSLDVNGFNTDNVTDMSAMFNVCSNLTSLDVSGFKTGNVTRMDQMFGSCSSLTSLDVSGFNTANVTNMSTMFYRCSNLTSLDVSGFNTENVTRMDYMFYGCSGLYVLNIGGFNTKNVANFEDMLSSCSSLAAILAGSANIPSAQYETINNPNLLVYVNEATLAPQGIQNVVIGETAQEIILVDAEGNNNWYCPLPFTAEQISYTRTFSQQTQIGVSRGWESIALPFKVQEITHETRGEISPFTNYQSQSMYHFWLRRLTHNGLQSVQEIDANTPYIISMPNSSEYAAEYNLAGKVTFSAQNAYVPETETMEDESADFIMVPLFIRVEKQPDIYALNVGEARGGHPEGSVFEKNYREVRPFEAFTKHFGDNGSRFMSIADMLDGGVTGIEELKDGKIEEWKSESWYDLNGRRVLSPSKGVFIQNGKKIVVK